MRQQRISVLGLALLLLATPAAAQFGVGNVLDKAKKAADAVDSLTFTDAEERQLGSEISTKLRDRFGVVQDRDIHRYVTLVGRVLAAGSTRPSLPWTFVVLDTDGVNAFAAPGGFIHITRGALALIKDEAELAAVLGHEIAHVTEKHTINAIKKSNQIKLGAQATRSAVLSAVAEQAYAMVLENSFDRNDETAADRVGVTMSNRAGYAPQGLTGFLTRLADRNKDLKERSGMFASHPESKARLDALARTISQAKLVASARVATRYSSSIRFPAVPVDAVRQAAPDAKPTAQTSESSGRGRFGLGSLTGQGRDRQSGNVSSAGSRGVNPDRDAAGGPVKTLVAVTVSAAEIDTFKRGITG